MWKIRFFLLAVAIALIIIIYSLPRIVVKNEQASDTAGQQEANLAGKDFSPEQLKKMSLLTENFINSDTKEKSAIFADSLASMYSGEAVYDSAAWYLSWIAENTGDQEALLKAGNMYYEAFETAPSREEAVIYAEKAREFLNEYLRHEPESPEAKTKMAMTYVVAEEPMKGIGLLTEVAREYPDYEPALFNLGILSMQSSQYERAIERFERLTQLNPNNVRAHFYLGLSYMEAGNKKAAKNHLEQAMKLSDDPEIKATAENYLKELK